jgi:hypothetical protein
MGLAAVYMFTVHGGGTPIPLDGTKRLVTSGVYAYITNPMQLCSALSWVIIGLFLQNVFVCLAAIMAFVFVLGMVRWHHRSDLLVRFPEGWLEYRTHVREWIPRWKPWIKHASSFTYSGRKPFLQCFANWLEKPDRTTRLAVAQADIAFAEYTDGQSGMTFSGPQALICTLFHVNFAAMLAGSALLIAYLPWHCLTSRKMTGAWHDLS